MPNWQPGAADRLSPSRLCRAAGIFIVHHRGKKYFLSCLLLAAGLGLSGSACTAPAWKSTLGRDNPMTGRIWDISQARFIEPETLYDRLASNRFVLLGEKHDNPDHHVLQAKALRAMVQRGRRPAVAFEMLNVDDSLTIARYLAASPKDAAGLGVAVGWNRRGWPDWALYQPIAEVALEAGLPIVAADMSPATLKQLRRGGISALDKAVVRRLGLDRPPPEKVLNEMKQDIARAHCGMAPAGHLGTMVDIQRARDTTMAERMIEAGHRDGTVLITGAGHARKDFGVPTHLASLAPDQSVISLAFVEVAEETSSPADEANHLRSFPPPFDYVWFTPRVDDRDPCERFEKQLERLKKEN